MTRNRSPASGARRQVNDAVLYPHRHFAQLFAAARPANAQTAGLLESRPVHGADQGVVLEQELAGRIVQPTPGVGADIEVAMDLFVTPQQNDTRLAVDQYGIDGGGAAIGNFIQPAQRSSGGYCIHRHLPRGPDGPMVARVSH